MGSVGGPRVLWKSKRSLVRGGVCGCLWNKGPWFCQVFVHVCVYFLRTVHQIIFSGLVPTLSFSQWGNCGPERGHVLTKSHRFVTKWRRFVQIEFHPCLEVTHLKLRYSSSGPGH